MNIAVITPTIGSDHLVQAMHSVGHNAEHWIVSDGTAYAQRVASMIQAHPYNQRFIVLPENTSTPLQALNNQAYNGFFNGYRINASIPLLVNRDYVMFLDEDNWFEPNHVETMINKIKSKDLMWSYSLRRICDERAQYVLDDDCESLGRYPTFYDHLLNFVDTDRKSTRLNSSHT